MPSYTCKIHGDVTPEIPKICNLCKHPTSTTYSKREAVEALMVIGCIFFIFLAWSERQAKNKMASSLQAHINETSENLDLIKVEMTDLEFYIRDLESTSNDFNSENWQEVVPEINSHIYKLIERSGELESLIERTHKKNELHFYEDYGEPYDPRN